MHTTLKSRIRKSLYGIMLIAVFQSVYGTGSSPSVHAQEVGTNTPTLTGTSIPASIPIPTDTPSLTATDLAMATPEEATFTLDGVSVSVRSTFLPSTDFIVSEPGAASQVATAVAWKPFQEFTVTAIPFGYKPGTEILPVASPGGKDEYDSIIRNYRVQQGGRVQDGSTITLFGQQVTSLYSLIEIPIDGPTPKPVAIEEWTAEAGKRLWIVRVSEEQSTNNFTSQPRNFVEDLTISSDTLDISSTIKDNGDKKSSSGIAPSIESADLSTPSWWQGDCDYDTYYQKSGGIGSYRLGAVYQNMPACGPRPYSDNAPDVLVHFFPGSWGAYEWECVELSMRFLYLMYGINPYQANGSQVVWNYSGDQLIKISNGTVGKAPLPNDVLSSGSTSTYGHTSVVTASNVDINGNGTITVIEQNASASGSKTLSVSNWVVASNPSSVSGWLHDTTAPNTPTSTPTPSNTPTSTPTPTNTLSVTLASTGSGTVTSDPAGINCGTDCSETYDYNTSVTLTATASTDSTFTGWSDGGCSGTGICTVTMDEDKSVTANFIQLLPPEIAGVHPPEGSQVCPTPQVGVALNLTDAMRQAGSFDLSTVTFTLDGKDVTQKAVVLGTLTYPQSRVSLSYTPTTALALGIHRAAFTFPSASGRSTFEWTFTVANAPCK